MDNSVMLDGVFRCEAIELDTVFVIFLVKKERKAFESLELPEEKLSQMQNDNSPFSNDCRWENNFHCGVNW